MVALLLAAGIVLIAVTSVAADVTYSVTLTDEQNETLVEHARIVTENPNKRAPVRSPVTPGELLQRTVNDQIDEFARHQAGRSAVKAWSERTPREKRLHCQAQKIQDCPK